jgi:type I restriction enzyme M protein
VKDYIGAIYTESAAILEKMKAFDALLADLQKRFDGLKAAVEKHESLEAEKKNALCDSVAEMNEAVKLYEADQSKLLTALSGFQKKYSGAPPTTNDKQHAARKAFDPLAEAIRGLVKQVDLIYKLAVRIADLGAEVAGDELIAATYDRRAVGKLEKQLDESRKEAVEQLKSAAYLHRQVAWLQDRFPKAELQAVPGLVKLVSRKDIEAADWSLTPGRFVGVAPPEVDEDFDFEQTLRDIHSELSDLNKEAAQLAVKIQENFVELGI